MKTNNLKRFIEMRNINVLNENELNRVNGGAGSVRLKNDYLNNLSYSADNTTKSDPSQWQNLTCGTNLQF